MFNILYRQIASCENCVMSRHMYCIRDLQCKTRQLYSCIHARHYHRHETTLFNTMWLDLVAVLNLY